MVGVEAEFFHQLGGSAAFAKVVIYANHLNGSGLLAGQQLAYRVSQTAVQQVLFGRNHTTCFGYALQDGIVVQWLDSVDVDDFCGNAFLRKRIGGFHSGIYQMSRGDDGDILAFVQQVGLADDEGCVNRGEVGY